MAPDNQIRARVGEMDMLRVEGAALKAGVSISEWVRRKVLAPDLPDMLQKRIDRMAEASGQSAGRVLATIVSDFLARSDAEVEMHGHANSHVLDLVGEGSEEDLAVARFTMQKATYMNALKQSRIDELERLDELGALLEAEDKWLYCQKRGSRYRAEAAAKREAKEAAMTDTQREALELNRAKRRERNAK